MPRSLGLYHGQVEGLVNWVFHLWTVVNDRLAGVATGVRAAGQRRFYLRKSIFSISKLD